MAKAAETPPDTLRRQDTALRLFRMMALIRRFEERTEEQYTRARIGGYCHLAIGEEASTVGAIDALEAGDCLYASYRDHGTGAGRRQPARRRDGRAVRQGDRRRPRPRRLHAPAGRAAPLLRRLGHRRRTPADRRRHRAGAHLPRPAHTPCSASSATAPSRPASSTRRSTWPASGTCRSSFRSSTTSTAWAPRSSSPRPSPTCGSGPPPTACTASGSTATTCWPCARPPPGCWRGAREERRPALLETITYRFRGHSVADAGKVYRTAEEIDSWRKRDPITRFGLLCSERGLLEPGRDRPDLDATSRPRSRIAIDEALERRLPGPRHASTSTSTATPPGASSSPACAPGPRSASAGEERTWQT